MKTENRLFRECDHQFLLCVSFDVRTILNTKFFRWHAKVVGWNSKSLVQRWIETMHRTTTAAPANSWNSRGKSDWIWPQHKSEVCVVFYIIYIYFQQARSISNTDTLLRIEWNRHGDEWKCASDVCNRVNYMNEFFVWHSLTRSLIFSCTLSRYICCAL